MQRRFISCSSHYPVQVQWEGEEEIYATYTLGVPLPSPKLGLSLNPVHLILKRQDGTWETCSRQILGAKLARGVHSFHWPELSHMIPLRASGYCAKAVCAGRKGDGV